MGGTVVCLCWIGSEREAEGHPVGTCQHLIDTILWQVMIGSLLDDLRGSGPRQAQSAGDASVTALLGPPS